MKNFFALLCLWFDEKRLSGLVKKQERLLRSSQADGLAYTRVHRECVRTQQQSKMMLSQVRRVLVDCGWRKEI